MRDACYSVQCFFLQYTDRNKLTTKKLSKSTTLNEISGSMGKLSLYYQATVYVIQSHATVHLVVWSMKREAYLRIGNITPCSVIVFSYWMTDLDLTLLSAVHDIWWKDLIMEVQSCEMSSGLLTRVLPIAYFCCCHGGVVFAPMPGLEACLSVDHWLIGSWLGYHCALHNPECLVGEQTFHRL